jgi:hypothetical protein
VLHTCELMSGKLTSVMKVIHLRLCRIGLSRGGPKRWFTIDFE